MSQPIYLTNTLSKKKEEFAPILPGQVKIYHCGPTVYWDQHIGNMRAVYIADIVHRTFLLNEYKVNFVRNYTDVGHLTGDNIGDADTGEDRMEKAAKRDGISVEAVAQKYIDRYDKDIKMLNVLPMTHTPRATEHIEGIINMIESLIAKGFAYITPLAVYFDVSKARDYTRLSGQKLNQNNIGQGTGDVADNAKKNAADFALWFFKAGVHENILQHWPSPFASPLVDGGVGFPGWHIECSAMSKVFLGETLDIHMGGIEHIPVHHTNEIAQSENANGADYVHYWLHNEHLNVDDKKMSKSEGTSYLVSDIIKMINERDDFREFFSEEEKPLVLRYFFLQSHYRSKQNFTRDAFFASATAYKKLLKNIRNLKLETGESESLKASSNIVSDMESVNSSLALNYKNKFNEDISDDFNTAKALATLMIVMKDKELGAKEKLDLAFYFDRVLGLRLA